MSARNAERMAAMNDRQRKKAYKAVNGYNPGKEQAVQQTIRDTIEYTERRLAEAETWPHRAPVWTATTSRWRPALSCTRSSRSAQHRMRDRRDP